MDWKSPARAWSPEPLRSTARVDPFGVSRLVPYTAEEAAS